MSTTYRSFAKINLHLRVLARRSDGYHELETLFQSVGDADRVTLDRTSGGVVVTVSTGDAPSGSANLAYRAADLFLERWAPGFGVSIDIEKRLPMGGGVGGGSSKAATVLLAMREMAGKPADRQELHEVARELGADVPYFLRGGTALGLGRGDELISIEDLPERPVWLVTPPIGISTAEVFGDPGLKRNSAVIDKQSAIAGAGRNDCQPVVERRFPALREMLNSLEKWGQAAMTGTGSALFIPMEEKKHALSAARQIKSLYNSRAVRGVDRSPVHEKLYTGGTRFL